MDAIYRTEEGRTCIDIRLHTAQQLFDNRDPAPFRQRDLDEDAIEYVTLAAEEIPARHPLRLVLSLDTPLPASMGTADLVQAIQAHFDREVTILKRRIRKQRRFGQLALAIGLLVLVVLLSLAQLASQQLPESALREVVTEGLVITGWVAMWRPIEVLLFDWWPLAERQRQMSRLLGAEIAVRPGKAAEPTSA